MSISSALKASSSSSSDEKSRRFCDAAKNGNLAFLRLLSLDPEVNVNFQGPFGFTPLILACSRNHVDIVRYLLEFQDDDDDDCDGHNHDGNQRSREDGYLGNPKRRLDCNLGDDLGVTAFYSASVLGHVAIVEMLLGDKRVDVNLADVDEGTPLWWASNKGRLECVKRILASGREIETQKRRMKDGNLTAAEGAREKGEIEIAQLIEEFEREPERVRFRLKKALGHLHAMAGELFSLVVYHSDGYLRLPDTAFHNNPCSQQNERAQKFFSLASRLPQDLQMVLCNRACGLEDSIVKRNQSEKGFRKFAMGF